MLTTTIKEAEKYNYLGERFQKAFAFLRDTDFSVLSEGKAGAHKIQGIGAGFVPDILNTKIYDEVFPVENEKAFEYGKELAKAEGIITGISSGAALYAAVEVAKRPENEGKTIVVLLPDNGDRYYSTPLFQYILICRFGVDEKRKK